MINCTQSHLTYANKSVKSVNFGDFAAEFEVWKDMKNEQFYKTYIIFNFRFSQDTN
jgi:hypothetical protein